MKILNGKHKIGDLVVSNRYYRPPHFGIVSDFNEYSVSVLWIYPGEITELCHTPDYPLVVSRFREHEHDRV